MTMLARVRSFVAALVSGRRLEREMEAELRFHLDARVDDLVASGLSRVEADRRARVEFGDPLRWKEEGREARGLRLLDEMRADVRYGLRWLRRSPGFAGAVVLSLALGIGANTAIFTLLNGVLLRSLPVERPEQLVVLATVETGKGPNYKFSFHAFQTFRQQRHELADIAATAPLRINVDVDGQTQPTAAGQMASGNYYSLLGVPAAIGRTLVPEDDVPSSASPVAVLSYGYWQRQFGRDPRVIGKVVRLNGQPFTIVGVSTPEFFGTHVGEMVEITVPLSMQPFVNAAFGASLIGGPGADDFWLELISRLRSGGSETAARVEANGIFQRQILPELLQAFGTKAQLIGHPHLELEPGSKGLSELRQRFSRPLVVLMAVVVLVLLIACANVANLLLARVASRRREMAVRVSLGAGRARLVRQLLTESVLLALIGGASGILLAIWSNSTLATLLVGHSGALDAGMDTRVLCFTLGVSVLTGIVFGTVPAFSTSHLQAFAALKESGHQLTSGGRRFGLRGWLVVAQVAISAVLLVGAGLFVRTLMNLRHLDLGFDQQVLAVRLEPRGSNEKHLNGLRLMERYGELLGRLERVPGVRSVSLSGATPLSDDYSLVPFVTIPGRVPQADENMRIRLMQIYPGYFATMGVPVLAGRDLGPADNASRTLFTAGTSGQPMLMHEPRVALINDTMARRFFGTAQAAIGRHFELRGSHMAFEIVGVVRDVRDRALKEDVGPVAYATYAQTPTGRGQMTLLVRTSGDPQAIVATISQLARDIDPAMPLLDVQTLAQRVEAATRQERLVALLSTLFGGLALVLAAVGLYGITAYAVARRRAEFGVRLALGASPGGLKRLVLSEGLTLVALGLVVGLVAAGATAQTLSHLLFGLQPIDPVAFGVAAATLVSVAAIAAYVPAREAARVDPIVALRSE